MATVYRTLELLEELDCYKDELRRWTQPLRTGAAEMLNGHHHHHLICLQCGRILEVEEDLLHQLEKVVEEKHNFQIINHYLQFFGYCSACRRAGAKRINLTENLPQQLTGPCQQKLAGGPLLIGLLFPECI